MSENNETLEIKAKLEFQQALKEENEKYRIWLDRRMELRAATEWDEEAQMAIWALCAANPLFWFDYFAWTYDPRRPSGQEWIPFILYDFQRKFILDLWDAIKKTEGTWESANIIVEKSRDMGISWLIVCFFLWHWMFHNGSFLIGSRKAEEIDKRGDFDTPFQKLRRELELQPYWLMPARFNWKTDDKVMLLINPQGGEIAGEASVPHWGRGGRKKVAWLDELPTWEHGQQAWGSCGATTQVRLGVGTPNGTDDILYELRSGKREKVDLYTFHWKQHPVKGAGAYIDKDGILTSHWHGLQRVKYSEEDLAAEVDIKYERSARGVIYKRYIPEGASDVAHGIENILLPSAGHMTVALDPGICFAVLWGLNDPFGRIIICREFISDNATTAEVASAIEQINYDLKAEYAGADWSWNYIGDPMGSKRLVPEAEEPIYTTLLNHYQIDVEYEHLEQIPTNVRELQRIEACRNLLKEYCSFPNVKSFKLLIDKKHCPETHKAFLSGYKWETDRYGKVITRRKPQRKNHPFPDLADCAGYIVLSRIGIAPAKQQKRLEIAEDTYEWDGWLGGGVA